MTSGTSDQQQELAALLKSLRDNPANQVEFGDTWTQGRSAFGGLSAAFAMGGMQKLLERPLPIRSLMVSFIAPLPAGMVTVRARSLRSGRNVIQMAAEVVCGGQVCLQAMGVFGQARQTRSAAPERRSDLPPRVGGLALHANPRAPEFLRYFEGSWHGGLPFSGSKDMRLGIWARHRSDTTGFAAEKIATLADIPPPVILSHYSEGPVPASSLSWSLEFVKDPGQIDQDWFFLDFEADHAADGYTRQSGRIYSGEGELCALSRQCMVYFEAQAG